MTSKKEVNSQLDYLANLRSILETYEEIAATRMARIRSTVLKSRDFLLEINLIFQEIKTSYKNEIKLLMKRKKIKDPQLTFLNRNNKTLQILISANTGLYGEIIRKTYNVFIENVKKEKSDVAIIGKAGYELFKEEKINALLNYFYFPDDKMDNEILKKIIEYIIQYQKVLVFYEKFNNVINQEPIITNISGDPLPWEEGKISSVKYFFEPSLEKIMAFFEKEIVGSIFEQTLMESQLAKFASRMVALDTASENTKNRLKIINLQKERIRHQDLNRNQVERFSTMLLWRK